MTAQVAPLVSMSNATDYNYWVAQGPKGAVITLILLIIGFAAFKGKIGFVSIGPSEAGIREFCGSRLWRVGPGLHPDIEGVWKVRKTSVARIMIRLDDDIFFETLTWQYGVTVFLKVSDTKAALIAQIYTAQDLNRENMENSQAVDQVTDILMGDLRGLLEKDLSSEKIPSDLTEKSERELLREYGYKIEKVTVRRLVKRPQSELAEAIATGELSSRATAAIAELETQQVQHLVAIEGGSAQADAR